MRDLYHLHYTVSKEMCVFVLADSLADATQEIEKGQPILGREFVSQEISVHDDEVSALPYLGAVPDERGEILIFKSDRKENGVLFYQQKEGERYTATTFTSEELEDQGDGIHAIALHLLNRFNKKQAKSEAR